MVAVDKGKGHVHLLLDTQMKYQTVLSCVEATVAFEPPTFSSLSDGTLQLLRPNLLTLFFQIAVK